MQKMNEHDYTPEETAAQLKVLASRLRAAGRTDLLLEALGLPVLEELRMEAARARLSHFLITDDFRFVLPDYGDREIVLQPVHKAVYLLFLAHPGGIEFKRLADYRDELSAYYQAIARHTDPRKIEDSIDHLVDPFDNAINEKCSRIKKTILEIMDEYRASYYFISSHTQKHISGTSHVWYERLKVIRLPRELVVNQTPYPLWNDRLAGW